jgi:hypothetical protein
MLSYFLQKNFCVEQLFFIYHRNIKEREQLYAGDEKVCVATKTTDVRDKMF